MEELVSEVNVLEVSAKQNSVDNITLLEEMKKKAEDLFKRQQINAKIAQDMGVKHRALNNTFLIILHRLKTRNDYAKLIGLISKPNQSFVAYLLQTKFCLPIQDLA